MKSAKEVIDYRKDLNDFEVLLKETERKHLDVFTNLVYEQISNSKRIVKYTFSLALKSSQDKAFILLLLSNMGKELQLLGYQVNQNVLKEALSTLSWSDANDKRMIGVEMSCIFAEDDLIALIQILPSK